MKNDQNKIVPESEQDGSDALTKEISRAMEMMKRVKKSNTVQFGEYSESQRMPSYLIPDEIVLCLAGD
jgi:hypothetical protein